MSVREGAAGSAGGEASERRGSAGQRVHFEALVAMAETSGGSGFEAESMDVSPGGMRLRTAYLPQVGEKLVCRFDSAGSEIAVEGEVIWRNEAARGGEFGIRFTDLDRETAESLKAICAVQDAPAGSPDAPSGGSSGAGRGTRVRLHIEGLGSPMKARVREADTGELRVGSNLEFLRVGRSLELEDVDRGVRREAHIDNVTVEIEPGTNIPQLVVALRYDDADKKTSKGAPLAGGLIAKAKEKAAALVSGPTKSASEQTRPDARKAADAIPEAAIAAETEGDEGAESDDDFEAEERRRGDKLRGIGTKAANAGKAVAGKVGPSLAAMGAKTKDAFAGLVAAVQKKRATIAESKKDASPRRMTAPPPTGALRSEGRKLVRDDNEQGEEGLTPEPPRANKKAAFIGSALGLVAVLAIFGVTRFIGQHRSQEAASADASTTTALTLPSGTPAAPGAPGIPQGASTGTLTADVPLFGATPLSTTEPVPGLAPAPSGSAAAGAPLMPGGPEDPTAAAGANAVDPASGDADEGGDEGGAQATSKKEWGTGGVRNPIVLKLKMDGAIEGISGASGAMGFTVSLPDRRSVSSASELARKDKRIASLQVVNNAHGAEVTVQFKDGVPPYLVKAKGDKLEIALGTEGHKKVASKSDHKKKSATASAKKKGSSGKGAKKKSSKK